MATVKKRVDMWTLNQVDKGRVYAKPYTMQQEVRIEVGKHAVHLSMLEAVTLIDQLESAIARNIRIGKPA
jgi:phosphopentomutase